VRKANHQPLQITIACSLRGFFAFSAFSMILIFTMSNEDSAEKIIFSRDKGTVCSGWILPNHYTYLLFSLASPFFSAANEVRPPIPEVMSSRLSTY
jgi:hypothetical protein